MSSATAFGRFLTGGFSAVAGAGADVVSASCWTCCAPAAGSASTVSFDLSADFLGAGFFGAFDVL